MDILVFGAGSLGSLIGGLLARVHDVTLVGRDPHMRRIRDDGLRVTGEIKTRVHPTAVTTGRNRPADVVIITTKAYDTETAAQTIATGNCNRVISLQNGLTEEYLDAALDAQVLAGTATYGARLVNPGVVDCTGEGAVTVGSLSGGADPRVEEIKDGFQEAGVETVVADDMPSRRWEKLAINAGINAPTALARAENGALADGPGATVARRAARETVRTARAEGIKLDESRVKAALEDVIEKTRDNHSSMLQDTRQNRRTEVDAIYGEVKTRARSHDVETPTVDVLANLVQLWESEHDVGPVEEQNREESQQ